jgi:hypothetical protein
MIWVSMGSLAHWTIASLLDRWIIDWVIDSDSPVNQWIDKWFDEPTVDSMIL